MAEQGLRFFLKQLVKECEAIPNTDALRAEYDFEPHTFVFEPTDLSTIMIKAALAQTQYGWFPNLNEVKYIKDQALVYGARLVDEVKALGGGPWGKDGCIIVIAENDNRVTVVPMGWQYDQAKKQGKDINDIVRQSAFNKVKVIYKEQIDAYFEDLQTHFGEKLVDGTKRKRGFRQKAWKTDKETGLKVETDSRAKSGTSVFRVTAGHKHGEGVVETSIARAFATTADNLSGLLKNKNVDLSQLKAMMKKLGIDFSCVRDDDHEGFVVRMEFGPENGDFGRDMKKAKEDFLTACNNTIARLGKKVGTLSGSDSIILRNRKLIIKEVIKEFKKQKGFVRVKHENIKLDTGKGNKATTTVGKATLKKQKRISMAAVAVTVPKARRVAKRKPAAPRMALKNILGVLNSQLPKTVMDNMGEPRLENRTGKFAQSVRAVDVTETAQGFKSIGYTYSKSPYQVFESGSGSRFSSIERDPRTLIDNSIREIVAQFGLGRLYTRRL